MKILIRMPNWLGDIVMATPVIEGVRKKYPEAHLTALLPEKLAPLLEKDPHLDQILGFRSRYGSLYQLMKQGKYDLGILLTNSFSSAFLMWAAGVKERIGYRGDGRSLFLTRWEKKSGEREHLVKTYQELLGGEPSLIPQLYVEKGERKHQGRVIGIHAGSAYGPAKCWPRERFRELAIRLKEEATVLFFGDAAGYKEIEKITEGLGEKVINLAGKTTIRELMELMSGCDVIVSNDSGPMHIADALGIPLVALFGSTDPRVTGPFRSKKVIWKKVSCSPCFKRECPIDFRCMKAIGVGEVFDAVQSL